MQIDTPFEKFRRCFQQCAIVLNRYHAAHSSDHKALGGETEFLPHALSYARGRRESLRIYSILNHTNSVRSQPDLPRMKFTQLSRHRENSICHGIGHLTKEPLAIRTTRQGPYFITVLTVDYDRHARQSSGGDCFHGTPISSVHNMRSILPKNPLQAEQLKLQAHPVTASHIQDFGEPVVADEAWIVPPRCANPVLELFCVKAIHQFQYAKLSTTPAQIIKNVHNAQSREVELCIPSRDHLVLRTRRSRRHSRTFSQPRHIRPSHPKYSFFLQLPPEATV